MHIRTYTQTNYGSGIWLINCALQSWLRVCECMWPMQQYNFFFHVRINLFDSLQNVAMKRERGRMSEHGEYLCGTAATFTLSQSETTILPIY